jgi:hypothetical protein
MGIHRVIYRSLKKEDLPSIMSLLTAFCEETNAGSEQKGLIDRIRTGETQGVIAENGSICGIVGYSPQGSIAAGEFLYVVPEKRGVIGGRLFNLAATQAREEQGCRRVIIIAGLKNSGRYKRRGYSTKYEVLEKEL